MKEELVSFELAKKLKELEFPQYRWLEVYPLKDIFKKDKDMCSYSEGELSFVFEETFDEDIVYENSAVAPTLSLAQKWFREERGIYICIDFEYTYKKGVECFCDISTIHASERFDSLNLKYQSNNFKTYEQALEAGLIKACELIEKK